MICCHIKEFLLMLVFFFIFFCYVYLILVWSNLFRRETTYWAYYQHMLILDCLWQLQFWNVPITNQKWFGIWYLIGGWLLHLQLSQFAIAKGLIKWICLTIYKFHFHVLWLLFRLINHPVLFVISFDLIYACLLSR